MDPADTLGTGIIRAGPAKAGEQDEFVEIRVADLRRYLKQRGQGLFIMRFVERLSEFAEPIPGLPPAGEFQTDHGRKTWHPGWQDREGGRRRICVDSGSPFGSNRRHGLRVKCPVNSTTEWNL